jgi:hypothetical protein
MLISLSKYQPIGPAGSGGHATPIKLPQNIPFSGPPRPNFQGDSISGLRIVVAALLASIFPLLILIIS